MSGNMTNTSAADMKMKQLSKKFRVTGLTAGALSGLTYGIYTTLKDDDPGSTFGRPYR